MQEQEMEKIMGDFIAERRRRPGGADASDADFTRRVMDSVRRYESERSREALKPSLWKKARGLGRAFLAPRPALAGAFVLVLAAILVWQGRRGPAGQGPGDDETRIKGGGFNLSYVLKRGVSVSPAQSGDLFLPGDRLQAVYSAPAAGHLHLFSVDAKGTISVLGGPEEERLLPAGNGKTLAYALELDADPEDEALVGIWTPGALGSDLAQKSLREAWEACGGDLAKLQGALTSRLTKAGAASVFYLRKRKASGI